MAMVSAAWAHINVIIPMYVYGNTFIPVKNKFNEM